MKRMLVPTDLSPSSKAGLKFAIQFASQYEVSLVFFYAVELLIPTRWSDVKAKIYMDEEIERESEDLRKFVIQTYKECKRRPGKFECVVRYEAPVSRAVLDYASEINASYICMGTRGAGKIRKLIGTHSSTIIKKSAIPVFAIPKSYKIAAIKGILYASDFRAVKDELHTIKSLAKKLGSTVAVVHYDYLLDPKSSKNAFDSIVKKNVRSTVEFHLEKLNWDENIGWHLNRSARKFKSDLVALFTDQKRPWYQRVFRSSNSAEASFESIKPLLVYPK